MLVSIERCSETDRWRAADDRTHGREVGEAGDEVNMGGDVGRQSVGLGRPEEVTLTWNDGCEALSVGWV